MVKATIVMREVGRLKPDYSLEFEFPEAPRPGDYISIHRPDKPRPYGEDAIVQKVWWSLEHPETDGYGSTPPKIGRMAELVIECSPAIGPWSSDHWRDSLKAALERGEVPEFEVARVSVRQDALK